MNKVQTGLLAMGLLLMSGALQAQKIKQIKNRARSNSESRSSSSSSGSGGSSSSGAGSDFIGSLCSGVFTGCFDSFINGLGSSSSSSSSSSNDDYTYTPPSPPPKPKPKPKRVIPRPIDTMVANKPRPAYTDTDELLDDYWGYFQLHTTYSFLPNNYQVFRPGARIRFGNDDGFGFAFSYRYNFLMEKVLGEFTSYFTHDIQLLQVSYMVGKHTEICVGGGLMIDEFEEAYPEILLGFNSLVDKTKWNLGTELRITPNHASGATALARIEWGANVQYALVNRPRFKVYGGVRSKVANYFGVNIWSIGLGVNMRVY